MAENPEQNGDDYDESRNSKERVVGSSKRKHAGEHGSPC